MRTLVWIIGRGGLLGSHIAAVLPSMPGTAEWQAPRIDWQHGASAHHAADFCASCEKYDRWTIVWAAGLGTLRSDDEAMKRETGLLQSFLATVASSTLPQKPGTLFFASTAGAMYSQHTQTPFDEHTPPHPTSAYGKAKLEQEAMATEWATQHAVSLLIGRISSLYGPGQNLQKTQGLISHMARNSMYGELISIYVPLDTMRDYYYAGDCAADIVRALRRMQDMERGTIVMKIFAAERVTTIADIIGIFRRLTKRHIRVVHGTHPAGALYQRSVRFTSTVWPETQPTQRTSLPDGIARVYASHQALYRAGKLPRS